VRGVVGVGVVVGDGGGGGGGGFVGGGVGGGVVVGVGVGVGVVVVVGVVVGGGGGGAAAAAAAAAAVAAATTAATVHLGYSRHSAVDERNVARGQGVVCRSAALPPHSQLPVAGRFSIFVHCAADGFDRALAALDSSRFPFNTRSNVHLPFSLARMCPGHCFHHLQQINE
jgi:hypothetical protein